MFKVQRASVHQKDEELTPPTGIRATFPYVRVVKIRSKEKTNRLATASLSGITMERSTWPNNTLQRRQRPFVSDLDRNDKWSQTVNEKHFHLLVDREEFSLARVCLGAGGVCLGG